MNPEEPQMSDPLSSETTEEYVARIRLSERVLPVLNELRHGGVGLVVESERRTSMAASLASDFVLELGDMRLRLILMPGHADPLGSGHLTTDALAHYMLDVPDTDSIAVVADDEDLSTWVFDVYGLHSDEVADAAPLLEALGLSFESNLHAIEIPNFRGALSLPSTEDLRAALERHARGALEEVRTSRARIEEKVTALTLIGSKETNRLIETLTFALQGEDAPLSMLIPEEDDDGD